MSLILSIVCFFFCFYEILYVHIIICYKEVYVCGWSLKSISHAYLQVQHIWLVYLWLVSFHFFIIQELFINSDRGKYIIVHFNYIAWALCNSHYVK